MNNIGISKKRLEKIIEWRSKYGGDSNVMLPAHEAELMAKALLEILEQKPAAEIEYATSSSIDGEYIYSVRSTHLLPIGSKIYAAPVAPAQPEQKPDGYIFCHNDGKLFWSITDDSNAGRQGVKPFYFRPVAPAQPVIPDGDTYYPDSKDLIINIKWHEDRNYLQVAKWLNELKILRASRG